jgi:hypothetical protein
MDTQLTDAGLKELAGLANLQRLDLRHTKVTDAGLKDLTGFKRLKELRVGGTRITDAGVMQLQKALPQCKVGP